MSRQLKQEALLSIACFDKGATLVSLANIIGCFHDDITLGTSPVVASQAIGPQDGQHLFLIIDLFLSFDLLDLKLSESDERKKNE